LTRSVAPFLFVGGRAGGGARSGWTAGGGQLRPWLELRTSLPVGAWLCVLHGPTAGRPWAASAAREELRAAAIRAGSAAGSLHISSGTLTRSRSRAKGSQSQSSRGSQHADLGVTSVYLRGIDNTEIIDTVHERRAPVMSANAGLRIGP
jgi:hypothetical protein